MKDSVSTFTDQENGAWLPLREASRRLGVSPATLRTWADEGRVPSFRTPGGHRRFRADATMIPAQSGQRESQARWRLLEHSVLGRVRVELEARMGSNFLTQLPPRARIEHRALGRQLVQLLVLALQAEAGDANARAEGLGKAYAKLHRRYGTDRRTALLALGFFRDAFQASVIEFLFGVGEPSPELLSTWLARGNAIIDLVCVCMLESVPEN